MVTLDASNMQTQVYGILLKHHESSRKWVQDTIKYHAEADGQDVPEPPQNQ